MARALGIAVAAFFVIGTAANAAEWTVTRFSGEVAISGDEGLPVSVALSTELPAGATVTTGKSGRVLLARGKETMTIGAGTVVTIPADSLTGFTTIKEQVGEILFDVEKRNVPHFAVETPFIAAVVKGTRFTVSVSSNGAGVSVERGRVGVTDIASRQQVDVVPGQVAKVFLSFSGSSSGLSVSAVSPPPTPRVTPRASNDDPFSALSRSLAKWMGSTEAGRVKHAEHGAARLRGGDGQFWKHWNFTGGNGGAHDNRGNSKGGKSGGWFLGGDGSRSREESHRSDGHNRGGDHGEGGSHGWQSGGGGDQHHGGHDDD